MGNAIRAVGRISMLQKSRSGSESSVQSDSDVSSQTDNSTFFSSRLSSDRSPTDQAIQQLGAISTESMCLPEEDNDPELTFLKEMVDCEDFVGDNARFDVRINGYKTMPPSVQWYHEGDNFIIFTNIKHLQRFC